ncbi:hypothetical protein G5V59_13675 [Nocardioides sp. W3-2-3]|uniref:hypothetical protein n=1 Tax=Nocardioides convexus TaxID=2712224 RepID=UPI0024182B3E|nr:hypothetical protein [Nocardioides convexus]NHA00703.1 hypothetical protein [Nocardioides convexus]
MNGNTGKGNFRPAPDQAAYTGTPDDVAALRGALDAEYGAGDDLGVLLAGPLAAGGTR